jgi:steroid delta-isomerase-like uncharacterized protein
MAKERTPNRAYLLRCWRGGEDRSGGTPHWRFTLEEVLPGRSRQGFADPESLLAFLRARFAQTKPGGGPPGPENGKERRFAQISYQKGTNPMSLQGNKDVVQRIIDLFNEGKREQLKELYTEDFGNHDPSAPQVTTRDALIQTFAAWWTGFPDAHTTIDDMIAEGDQVAKRFTFRGTQTGEFQGIPPTGKSIAMTGITIYRFAGGKVAECWWNYDTMGAMQQLGVIPPMG